MNDRNKIVIETAELTKKFGNFTAVDKISFQVKKGEVFGFLGANGAGKTTAIRMLTGLLKPSSGNAMVAGRDIYKQHEQIKKRIGYMSQKFSLYEDLTVRENILFYGGIYGIRNGILKEKAKRTIEKQNLNEVKDSLISSLPAGWKQKLAFSIALLHEPEIIFLDEPTGGVDPVTRRQFWDLIYETAAKGTTVFVTTHYMDEAEYCDRISIMNEGRIEVIGEPDNLKKKFDTKSINELFVKIARPA